MAGMDPAAQTRAQAAMQIDAQAPNIELSNQQCDQMMAKLVAMIEKYHADVAKANETDPDKLGDWRSALYKNMREAIDSLLTDEQRKQAAANRAEQFKTSAKIYADGMLKYIDRADPTEDQKLKAAALAATAREAMLKLATEDYAGLTKLRTQLRDDIEKLLTEEQRAKLHAPPSSPAGG